MKISKLKLLTFDVTNTLLKFRRAPAIQYGEIGAMYGILCDNDTLAANFKVHWHRMNKEHPNYGLHSGLGWEHWWKQIIVGTFKDSKSNVDHKKLEAISSHLIDAYKTSAYWQHCHGVLDLLSYLKHKGIPLGIISNFDPRLNTTLANAKLRHYFKFVLTSYEVGIEKPHPDIFNEAMKVSNIKDLKPEECMHVGDAAHLDYKGAKSAGWQAALIHNEDPNKLQEKHDYLNSEHVFASLFDLHKYIMDNNLENVTVRSNN